MFCFLVLLNFYFDFSFSILRLNILTSILAYYFNLVSFNFQLLLFTLRFVWFLAHYYTVAKVFWAVARWFLTGPSQKSPHSSLWDFLPILMSARGQS